MQEGGTDRSRKLMENVWRDGAFADYAKVPLENCIALDEAKLCQELGYSVPDLVYTETIIVCPATGGYGGAGIQVAIALGARVVAMGRNEKELARLKEHVRDGTPNASIDTAKITGNIRVDTAALQSFGTIDAVLDFSPSAAANSTHLRSALASLRRNERCSAMGFTEQPIIDWKFIGNNVTVKGKFMYERDDMIHFVKVLERGLFPKGKAFVDTKTFGMEDWKLAFDTAAEHTGIGKLVVISP